MAYIILNAGRRKNYKQTKGDILEGGGQVALAANVFILAKFLLCLILTGCSNLTPYCFCFVDSYIFIGVVNVIRDYITLV